MCLELPKCLWDKDEYSDSHCPRLLRSARARLTSKSRRKSIRSNWTELNCAVIWYLDFEILLQVGFVHRLPHNSDTNHGGLVWTRDGHSNSAQSLGYNTWSAVWTRFNCDFGLIVFRCEALTACQRKMGIGKRGCRLEFEKADKSKPTWGQYQKCHLSKRDDERPFTEFANKTRIVRQYKWCTIWEIQISNKT